jgi:hypothetical protein
MSDIIVIFEFLTAVNGNVRASVANDIRVYIGKYIPPYLQWEQKVPLKR